MATLQRPVGRNRKSREESQSPSTEEDTGALSVLERVREEKRLNELASYIDSEYTKCKTARQPFERQWYVNLAFVNGRHYVAPVSVPGQGFKLVPQRSPSYRVKLVINKCRTAVRTECAKLTSSRPVPVVVPATNEDEDFAAAKVAEQLLKAAFGSAEYEKKYRSFVWWGSVTGTAFLKQYYDKSANDYVFPYRDDLIPKAGGGGFINDNSPREPKPSKGKICVDRVTPFHIYVPDLLAEDINEQPYVIHVMTQSKEWVKRQFNFNATCDTRASNTVMDTAFVITKNAESHLDSVLVKEVWFKPGHRLMKEGGVVTVVNGKVVQHTKKWPYPFEEYPFYKYDGIPTGGFYSDSMLVDLIPLNKEYNRTRSQMVEIKNTVGKPKLLYPKGSINPRMITSEPGQGIPYTPGFDKPTPLPGVEVPASFVNELQVLSQDFDDLSGQHEITRGQSPTSVTAGTAIAFLQEQDDAKLTYQVASIEYATETMGRHYLKFVSRFWDVPRIVRVTGKENFTEAKAWKGSDLRGNTDVTVQTGSALPYSKAARNAMLTEFMQMGWIQPHDGLDMMNLGGLDKVIDEVLVDKKQATRENLRMSELTEDQLMAMVQSQQEGVAPKAPIPVNSWDNHEAHIHFHNQFRKTQQFELLSDLHKQAFELHVQTHILAMSQPAQGQLGTIQPQQNPEQAMEQQAQMQQEAQMAKTEGDLAIKQQQADTQAQQAAAQMHMQQMQMEQEAAMKAAKSQVDQTLAVAQIGQTEAQTELAIAQAERARRSE